MESFKIWSYYPLVTKLQYRKLTGCVWTLFWTLYKDPRFQTSYVMTGKEKTMPIECLLIS